MSAVKLSDLRSCLLAVQEFRADHKAVPNIDPMINAMLFYAEQIERAPKLVLVGHLLGRAWRALWDQP